MDLGDIYSNNVNKSQINMHGTGGMPVSRERDPQIKKLENDVFSSIQSKLNDELPPQQPEQAPQPEVKSVNFADALKELRDLGKS
tara:strand:- start:221 stop:475 length:255 start_codon:yes stop_codon:yes gene_type:complete